MNNNNLLLLLVLLIILLFIEYNFNFTQLFITKKVIEPFSDASATFDQSVCDTLVDSKCYALDGKWCSDATNSKTDKQKWMCANCSICRVVGGTASGPPLPENNSSQKTTQSDCKFWVEKNSNVFKTQIFAHDTCANICKDNQYKNDCIGFQIVGNIDNWKCNKFYKKNQTKRVLSIPNKLFKIYNKNNNKSYDTLFTEDFCKINKGKVELETSGNNITSEQSEQSEQSEPSKLSRTARSSEPSEPSKLSRTARTTGATKQTTTPSVSQSSVTTKSPTLDINPSDVEHIKLMLSNNIKHFITKLSDIQTENTDLNNNIEEEENIETEDIEIDIGENLKDFIVKHVNALSTDEENEEQEKGANLRSKNFKCSN